MTTDVQTCYRHDDRRAGVRCQRCDRPICPSCMTQASVGFHCPECLKQSGQKVVTARSIAALTTPYVTYALIAINAVMFAVSSQDRQFEVDYALIGNIRGFGVVDGDWWRIVTGGFLHANLLHIGMNMYLLFLLGRQMENGVGRLQFGSIYFASLLSGSLGVLILDPESFTVGASGAVYGMFGFMLVAQKARGVNPMQSSLGGLVLINLIFTFSFPGISIGGHVGGLIGGALAGAITEFLAPQLKLPKLASSALVLAFAVAVGAACLFVGASL